MKKALSQKSAADKDVVNFREDFFATSMGLKTSRTWV
jgi:hypothetical protein